MKPVILAIVVVLALGTIAFFFAPRGPVPFVQGPTGANFYANGTYGISFEYPATYVLTEPDLGATEGTLHAINLVHERDLAPRENSEGPMAITITVHEGDSLEAWLQTSASNFALGPGETTATSVNGAEALSYRWSGLYEGETTAFVHDGNVIAVSVTYIAPEDEIRTVYYALLSSLDLQ